MVSGKLHDESAATMLIEVAAPRPEPTTVTCNRSD
jgi:hypothetical protein